jgi:hypothetical protein
VTAYRDDAAFYRAALLLGLIRGEDVVGWADEAIGQDATAPQPLIELSTTNPDDLSALRRQLFELSGEGESGDVVRRVLGLVQRDLTSGRRSFADTRTVLKQLRAFLKLNRDLDEQLKTFGVDLGLGREGAEQRLRDWLRQHE